MIWDHCEDIVQDNLTNVFQWPGDHTYVRVLARAKTVRWKTNTTKLLGTGRSRTQKGIDVTYKPKPILVVTKT